ncbi:phospholipase D-like domain-containing protein, partial [Pseudomonas sp. PA-6-1H]
SRLMRAGWIEITSSHPTIKFSATLPGRIAADRTDLPNSVIRLNKNINFIIDEISGTTFKNHEIQFYDHNRIKNLNNVVKLNKPINPPPYNPDELASLFLHDDEKIVGIDGIISRPFSGYAVFTVINEKIENQPSSMPKELEVSILTAARHVRQFPDSHDTIEPTFTPPKKNTQNSFNINESDIDILLGAESHKNYLTHILEKSISRIFIHSTFIREQCFDILLPLFRSASARGVKIFIYWGQEESDDSTTLKSVTEIRRTLETEKLNQSIYISPRSTGSHSKLIISDSGPDGTFVSAVGSCNWLSSPFNSFEGTTLINDATINNHLTNIFIRLITQNHWNANTNELLRAASEMQTYTTIDAKPQNSKVTILTGSQHADMILNIRDNVESELLITSNKLSAASKPTIIAPLSASIQNNPNIKINLLYGMNSGGFTKREIRELGTNLSAMGLNLSAVNRPGLHAKIIAWDYNNLIVSSLNWLSTTEIHPDSLHEVGVYIESRDIGTKAQSVILDYQSSLK